MGIENNMNELTPNDDHDAKVRHLYGSIARLHGSSGQLFEGKKYDSKHVDRLEKDLADVVNATYVLAESARRKILKTDEHATHKTKIIPLNVAALAGVEIASPLAGPPPVNTMYETGADRKQ